jgi:hypothetical protein
MSISNHVTFAIISFGLFKFGSGPMLGSGVFGRAVGEGVRQALSTPIPSFSSGQAVYMELTCVWI